jgi:hypothetical protein
MRRFMVFPDQRDEFVLQQLLSRKAFALLGK